jgi:hypothetical protein
MYTETEFMDMSLVSRIDKLKSEVSKLVEWGSIILSLILDLIKSKF